MSEAAVQSSDLKGGIRAIEWNDRKDDEGGGKTRGVEFMFASHGANEQYCLSRRRPLISEVHGRPKDGQTEW